MADVAGKPLVLRVVERVVSMKSPHEVVLATTDRPEDAVLLDLSAQLRIPAFAGSSDDVLDRYFQAAKAQEADIIVRVTADCPLFDPAIGDLVVSKVLEEGVDYASNVHPPTFPDGLDVEVFTTDALTRAWSRAANCSEREHVTSFIWNNPELFRIANVSNAKDLSHLRWTVDEEEDLFLVRALYDVLALKKNDFHMIDVLDILRRQPELAQINAHLARNSGYLRSLASDSGTV